MSTIDSQCKKEDSVKIIQFCPMLESPIIIKSKTTIFGLGDDGCMYYWNYKECCWINYSSMCMIHIDENGKKTLKET